MIRELFAGQIRLIYSPPRIQKKTAANKSPFFFLPLYLSPAMIGEDWREIQKQPGKCGNGSFHIFSNAGSKRREAALGCEGLTK